MTRVTPQESVVGSGAAELWPAPQRLMGGLEPVLEFPDRALPDGLREYVLDIAERMQTPPEYVAVPAIIAAGSVIGRKIGVRPQRHTDWQEAPNLWGCIIGRPGVMKSPAVKAALKPLMMLVASATQKHAAEMEEYKKSSVVRELRTDAAKKAMKARVSKDPHAELVDLQLPEESEPVVRRYLTHDSSYQALGELLRHNQNGILIHRDEIMSLLRMLDREDNSEGRGFYLTGWNGSDTYIFDRIGRGSNLIVPSLTLSLVGSTQPGLIQSYVRNVLRSGSSDDGMLQRLGMMVWPDLPPSWQEHDREPDARYREAAYATFRRLDTVDALDVGAVVDPDDRTSPYLRFSDEGVGEFRDWRAGLEHRLRSAELHPAMESQLSKYRKLVPALALIHHLASNEVGPIGHLSVLSALSWAEYLESHAHRVYAASMNGVADGAKVILAHLRSGDLQGGFTARQVQRKNWAGLGDDRERVRDALDLLEELGWIRAHRSSEAARGGTPATAYLVNPRGVSS